MSEPVRFVEDMAARWADRRSIRRVFRAIHASRSWGSDESASGPGSTRARAADFLDELVELIRGLGVSVLLDAPCGDFNWAGPVADAVDSYIGIDVVRALIRRNRRLHASPRRRFACRDVVHDRLPAADLVLCRDALVHLSTAHIRSAVENLRRTGATHLITTTFVGERANDDVPTGDWRPLNLERPPFSFPAPLALIDERCRHSGGVWEDKRLALWRFADLPSRTLR